MNQKTYEGPERRSADEGERDQKAHWHLDRTFSLSHIITTISAIVAALMFASKLDTRVSLLEQAQSSQRQDVSDFKQTVRADLQKISDKLDRLIERASK